MTNSTQNQNGLILLLIIFAIIMAIVIIAFFIFIIFFIMNFVLSPFGFIFIIPLILFLILFLAICCFIIIFFMYMLSELKNSKNVAKNKLIVTSLIAAVLIPIGMCWCNYSYKNTHIIQDKPNLTQTENTININNKLVLTGGHSYGGKSRNIYYIINSNIKYCNSNGMSVAKLKDYFEIMDYIEKLQNIPPEKLSDEDFLILALNPLSKGDYLTATVENGYASGFSLRRTVDKYGYDNKICRQIKGFYNAVCYDKTTKYIYWDSKIKSDDPKVLMYNDFKCVKNL